METHNPSNGTIGFVLALGTLVATLLFWIAARGELALVVPVAF